MQPYYQDGGVTIYCADNKALVGSIGDFDLLLTDPPYGLNKKMQGGRWGSNPLLKPMYEWDFCPEVKDLMSWVDVSRNSIIWGGNYFELPPCRGFLLWMKRPYIPTTAVAEYAWTTFDSTSKAFTGSPPRGDNRLHPTQKSLPLFRWCLEQSPGVKSIVDPFMGSGTSLVAAQELGITATGIDANKDYCDIAIKRLQQQSFSW